MHQTVERDQSTDAGLLLVPSDPLNPRRTDEHFASEAAAARDAGWQVALVDHDALTRLDARADSDAAAQAVRRVPPGRNAVYRGWMLRSEQYEQFASTLSRREVTLRTSPDQYRRAHELPGWHAALSTVTPEAAWTTDDTRSSFDRAREALGSGAAVLRDYTKSMKHYWQEAVFIPDLTDAEAAWTVAARFRELRDDEFTGGFVLRRFERFEPTEVRTWWIDGHCRLVGPHPDTPDAAPETEPDLTRITPLVASLELPFVTVDLVQRDDGQWRIVELGDGQVSDRPSSIPPARLIATLSGDSSGPS